MSEPELFNRQERKERRDEKAENSWCCLRSLGLLFRQDKLADFELVGAKIDQHPVLKSRGFQVAEDLRFVFRRQDSPFSIR